MWKAAHIFPIFWFTRGFLTSISLPLPQDFGNPLTYHASPYITRLIRSAGTGMRREMREA